MNDWLDAHLLQKSLGLVAEEESRPDESLAVPHEVVGEEAGVHT